ncbi:MAG: hypothetical protein M3342_11100 [Bacteroidota bacterium]|nr:hypothetical protein [Bacteroidota bacterium]
MHRYFYGVRVQGLTPEDIAVEFCLVLGSESDVRAWGKLPLDVAPQSCLYRDAGYTDYLSEEDLFEAEMIDARVQRKANSKRKDEPHEDFLKEHMGKEIETDFSQIKAKMLRSIHALTQQGFLLKVTRFGIAYSFHKMA